MKNHQLIFSAKADIVQRKSTNIRLDLQFAHKAVSKSAYNIWAKIWLVQHIQ